MPLKAGKENIGSNISELMAAYGRKKKIGKAKPKTKKDALQMAIAIAYDKARE